MWLHSCRATRLFGLLLRQSFHYNQVSLVRALGYLRTLEQKRVFILDHIICAALSVSIKLMEQRSATEDVSESLFSLVSQDASGCLEDTIRLYEAALIEALDYDLFADDGADVCLAWEAALRSPIVATLSVHAMNYLDSSSTAAATSAAANAWHLAKALLEVRMPPVDLTRCLQGQSTPPHDVVHQLLILCLYFHGEGSCHSNVTSQAPINNALL